MFFSRLSKLAFALLLLTSISCGTSTTANNKTTTNQATPPPSNSAQGPPSDIQSQIEKATTKEEIVRLKALENASKTVGPEVPKKPFVPAPSPEERPKEIRDNKFANPLDTKRAVIRYYNFLTDVRGLNLNKPKEMDGGTSAFKSNDVLQFTFKNQPEDKPIAVLVAEFNNLDDQIKGTGFMRKMSGNQRKLFQVNNYSMLVLGGDEKVHKILTDSLEKFR